MMVLGLMGFSGTVLEILVKAWFPHNYFKLSFGVIDQIPVVLDKLIIT
jgi:hypothetical protein